LIGTLSADAVNTAEVTDSRKREDDLEW